METIHVRIPASSANLGPGFDCLGLALDIWNQARFRLAPSGLKILIQGEGRKQLPTDSKNLIYQAFNVSCEYAGIKPPRGLEIDCILNIPVSSGLGSSASAVLLGVLGANALMNLGMDPITCLNLGSQIEGHPDNIAPALYGGLTNSMKADNAWAVTSLTCYHWPLLVLLPDSTLSTAAAREALPKTIALSDAVFNIGHSVSLVQALASGNLADLRNAMQDRLHQAYRLPLLPGAAEMIETAHSMGAAAALSGAGPACIVFAESQNTLENLEPILSEQFNKKGVEVRSIYTSVDVSGAQLKE